MCGLDRKIVTSTLLTAILFASVLVPLNLVIAQNTNLGVSILQVDPSSLTGTVGQTVNVQGTIYTSNNTYQIIFGRTLVTSGKSEGFYVNTNFTVPEVASGSYTLTLRDLTINVNSTRQFTVTTGYSINPSSNNVQQGSNVVLTAQVTGAKPGTQYSAEIVVALPSSINTQYTKTVSLGTADQKGTASAQVTFPDASFQPGGSSTNYVGEYTVTFNSTLAEAKFNVGILGVSSVHRGESISVRAIGYHANEDVTITVTNVKTGTAFPTQSATASENGEVRTTWTVPNNAAIGEYTIKITGSTTNKQIQDSATFKVEGFNVKVQTLNIAGTPAPSILVKALDVESDTSIESQSGSDGIANFKLEKGPHVLTAFWNEVEVGQVEITVNGEGTFALTCQLTNLKINVNSESGVGLAFVDLEITYRYQTATGTKTGTTSGRTGASGSYTLTSTLSEASYTINASVYNQVFNLGNNTVASLERKATSEVTIICPSRTLNLNVVSYGSEPIPDARIELIELTNGLFYTGNTDSSGSITSEVTFGKYRARIYKDNILINESTLDAFNSGQKQIRCTLYDIQVIVSVVDFFGSPIPNVGITLNGPENEKLSAETKGDGKAIFDNVIGGDMQVVAALGVENAYQTLTLTVDQPMTIQMKIDKYVALGPMLIQTSSLLTVLIVLVAVLLFALVEVYRRKKTKPNTGA